MKDTNDKELELFRQYRRIVPDGHGDGRIIPPLRNADDIPR